VNSVRRTLQASVAATIIFTAIFARSAVAAQDASFENGFASIVARTLPAVVNVAAPKRAGLGEESRDQPPVARRGGLETLGSGVIVAQDGLILTSYHVIEGVPDIKVFLSDNRPIDARVVGGDSKTDIAVLKINGQGFPVVSFGNSSSVRVGDVVLAIGNPLGLQQTVTFGIVSGTGRNGLGIQDYEDFIQTDAAVNPGSSGGALVNARGELIGIITAGKEYSGIGFAVPADTAAAVMSQIVKSGRVIRGSLDATVQPLTRPTAKAFGFTGELHGALIAGVGIHSPAKTAGLREGDIILEIDGRPIRDDRDLDMTIGKKAPGESVRLKTYRDQRTLEIMVALVEEPSQTQRTAKRDVTSVGNPLGLSVQTVTPEISEEFAIDSQTRGVVVTNVERGSKWATAQLAERDIIIEVNRKPVTTAADFGRAIRNMENQPVLLLIERTGTRMFLVADAQ
jgi:Do/DeqQ family serine protease